MLCTNSCASRAHPPRSPSSGVRPVTRHRWETARFRRRSDWNPAVVRPTSESSRMAAGIRPNHGHNRDIDYGRDPARIQSDGSRISAESWPQSQHQLRPWFNQISTAIKSESSGGPAGLRHRLDSDRIMAGIRPNRGRNRRRDCGCDSAGFLLNPLAPAPLGFRDWV